MTVPKSPRFARLHELSRFYNQLNNDWDHRLVQLHIALEQTFPELKQLFKNKTSKLALNIVELFPHPDFVKLLSRTKLKNRLIKSTDKKLSNMKGFKYADQLLKLAQDAYPAASQDSVQVDEVRYYCRLLIELTKQKEKIVKQMITTAQEDETFQYYVSFPGIGPQTAAQLMAELGDISRFDNANQLNAYVGIDIQRYQSGQGGHQDHK
ncbi:transposase [Limosilactobacillus vaginalis]|uniref:transposase n=1 Tax=Limosilactobacillus vaginalis TaxID=1633 RepID=UPI003AAF09C8